MKKIWIGRVMSGLAVAFLLMDSLMKVLHLIEAKPGDELLLGFSPEALPTVGWLLLISTIIHLVPRTSLLGAVLLTGYLGGAVAAHVRVDNPLLTHTLFPIYFAALIWGGLMLRQPRVRLLLPGRNAAFPYAN